jgi:hypothetical protein
MSAWTSFVNVVRPSSNGHAPQPLTDPMNMPATLTVGQLLALESKVIELGDQIMGMRRVESRSVRRLFLLALNVGRLLKATSVTSGEPVGNDAVRFSLSNDAGKWLEMTIYPFREKFVLSDATGVMTDAEFRFGEDTDLSRETVLMLAGYAEFASRHAADDSDAYWASSVNQALAPVDELVPVHSA